MYVKSVVTHSLNLQQYGFRSVADPTWKRPPGGGRGQWLGGGHHGKCGARAHNGGRGAEAP